MLTLFKNVKQYNNKVYYATIKNENEEKEEEEDN